MKAEELNNEIAKTVQRVQNRISTVGKAQYQKGDNQQQFETMHPFELLDFTEEEALDLVAYATMWTIRVRRMRAAMTAAMSNALARHIEDAAAAQQPVEKFPSSGPATASFPAISGDDTV